MGTTSSGHSLPHSFSEGHPSDNACGTSVQSSACSLCTQDNPRKNVCRDEEEVLVESCSVLEELGFFHGAGSGKRAFRSPARTGGLCHIVPMLMPQGIPPSPARARCCLKAHCGDSPTVLAPQSQYNSPCFVDCPPPLRITESPPKPTYLPFDIDSPSPLPILPPPSPDSYVGIQSPVAAASVRCSAPLQKLVEGRDSEINGRSTLVDIDEDLSPDAVPPTTPMGRLHISSVTSACDTKDTVAVTAAPAQPSPRPKRPWSTCHGRSPYRGGVLSLFTPSPPSPPRRRPIESPTLPPGKELKDLGEDDQIALAIAKSLQYAGREPENPPGVADSFPAEPCPETILTVKTAPPDPDSKEDSRRTSAPPKSCPKTGSRAPQRCSLLRWRPRRANKQSI
mmetsp:Transcript_83591/g.132121  ORF Transcript_83591/g.132121 Transcript_83591/m.132121 type:complete len:395 (-) Transcript_83591:189-1373(-)